VAVPLRGTRPESLGTSVHGQPGHEADGDHGPTASATYSVICARQVPEECSALARSSAVERRYGR
jgi:hypothetical protein